MRATATRSHQPPSVEVLGLLTEGGMSEIYLGRLQHLGAQTLVLKRLHPKHAKAPQMQRMFRDEARVSRLVSGHPNIVSYLGEGQLEGSEYIALEYVEGLTVAELISRCAAKKAPVPPQIAVHIVLKVLQALDHAHQALDEQGEPLKLIHRDVTPQNVLITWQGQVKLLDFGVSHCTGRLDFTQPGLAKGKPLFMAPEQLQMDPLDHRVDLYAAAVILYVLVTLRHPFEGHEDMNVLAAMMKGSLRDPRIYSPELPESFCQDVLQSLSLAPQDRFKDAKEMQEALLTSAIAPCSQQALSDFVHGLKAVARPDLPGPILNEVSQGPPTIAAHEPFAPTPAPPSNERVEPAPGPNLSRPAPQVAPALWAPALPVAPQPSLRLRATWALVWVLAGLLAATWAMRLLALSPQPALRIDSAPPMTDVFIDGQLQPTRGALSFDEWPGQGPLVIRWSSPSHQDCRTVVDPRPGSTVHAQCRLQRKP